MKTSRIILLSFFSFIGLLLLSFLIAGFAYNDAGIKDRKKRRDEFEKLKTTIRIEKQFKHIFVKNKGSVTINQGDEQLLEHQGYNIKDSLKVPKLEIKNDTLFLNVQPRMNIILTIKEVNNLKSVRGDNSNVSLSNIKMPALDLYFKGGKINLIDNTKIKNISVTLNEKSEFDIHHNVVVDTLHLDINNSTLNFYNANRKIYLLKGTIDNNSNVRVPKALHFSLDIDESSKFNMW